MYDTESADITSASCNLRITLYITFSGGDPSSEFGVTRKRKARWT